MQGDPALLPVALLAPFQLSPIPTGSFQFSGQDAFRPGFLTLLPFFADVVVRTLADGPAKWIEMYSKNQRAQAPNKPAASNAGIRVA